jgi:hypothetical protein
MLIIDKINGVIIIIMQIIDKLNRVIYKLNRVIQWSQLNRVSKIVMNDFNMYIFRYRNFV